MGTVRSTSLTDFKFDYNYIYLVLLLFHLTIGGEIGVRSKLSPPRLLGASVLSEHIPSQLVFSILCAVGFSSSFDVPTSEKSYEI